MATGDRLSLCGDENVVKLAVTVTQLWENVNTTTTTQKYILKRVHFTVCELSHEIVI